MGWSALQSMGWPELLYPRTRRSEVLICRDAGPAAMWLRLHLESQLILHQTGKDHPSAGNEYLHICPVLGHDRFWSAALHTEYVGVAS